jgi:hypothetical protein
MSAVQKVWLLCVCATILLQHGPTARRSERRLKSPEANTINPTSGFVMRPSILTTKLLKGVSFLIVLLDVATNTMNAHHNPPFSVYEEPDVLDPPPRDATPLLVMPHGAPRALIHNVLAPCHL